MDDEHILRTPQDRAAGTPVAEHVQITTLWLYNGILYVTSAAAL